MDPVVQFTFRNKTYSSDIYIDNSLYPCYVFVMLSDEELIHEFGDEVIIKTDCEKLLPKDDDYPELIELRQTIFDVIKMIPEFLASKTNRKVITRSQSAYISMPEPNEKSRLMIN